MCECLKPAYTEHDFGFGLGVLGHQMSDVENLGFRLFSGVNPSQNEDYVLRVDALIDNLNLELRRAKEVPLEEIPDFKVTWSPTEDFQSGYVSGLSEMLDGLLKLQQMISAEKGKGTDYFAAAIYPWAEAWQENYRKFNFHEIPPFASTDLRGGDELRILTTSRALLSCDGGPSDFNYWVDLSIPGLTTEESLVSELWSANANEEQGISFECGVETIGPQELDQEVVCFFIPSLCQEHWKEIVALNTKFLNEAGFEIDSN